MLDGSVTFSGEAIRFLILFAAQHVIGHVKAEHRMGRNYLKGRDGDAMPCSPPPATTSASSCAGWKGFCAPLSGRSSPRRTSQLRQTILRLVQRRDRCAHAARATSSDDAKLGEMTAQRIDQHRSLGTKGSRTLWSIRTDCWSTVLTATKRIVGRVIASAIASASAASVLPRFTYGLT